MDTVYKSVSCDGSLKEDRSKWIYFFRQLLVASGAWNVYFLIGLFLGSPTVFIPQFRLQANTTEVISDEMASWLSSMPSYSAIPWVILLPYVARSIGRKRTSIIMSLSSIIAYIVFYCSAATTQIMIAEIFIGLPHASTLSITVFVLTEFTSPRYRGIFLAVKSATLYWGIWVSNIIGTFANWTYIPLVGFCFSIYSLTVLFWPESPQWLASKKRYNECRNAHRWLKGTDEEAEKELDRMIKNEMVEITGNYNTKEFYMPLALSFIAIAQNHLSGKFVFSIYAVDIIKKIAADKSIVYKIMLIIDGITVFSTYIGCGLSKVLKRRTLLLSSSSLAIIFLYTMSLYLFLINLNVISENKYLSVFFLAGFSISISSGPLILATSLFGELIPSRFKSVSVTIIGISFFVLQGTSLKVAPLVFNTFGMDGTFLFYGVMSTILLIYMYIYLPETKDKTLLEIEEYFKDKKKVNYNLVFRK